MYTENRMAQPTRDTVLLLKWQRKKVEIKERKKNTNKGRQMKPV